MKMAKLVGAMILAAACMFGGISVGIRIGPPPSPRVIAVRPVAPGPGFVWVEGYWYPDHGHYRWHDGYWTQAPYEGAYWVGPRYEGGLFINGYWEGGHGRVEHNHRWDRDDRRDYRRGHDRDDHHDRH